MPNKHSNHILTKTLLITTTKNACERYFRAQGIQIHQTFGITLWGIIMYHTTNLKVASHLLTVMGKLSF